MMGYAILPHFAVVAMEIQFGGRFQVPILAPPSTTVSDIACCGDVWWWCRWRPVSFPILAPPSTTVSDIANCGDVWLWFSAPLVLSIIGYSSTLVHYSSIAVRTRNAIR
jgi:hypothetical protein